jgi:hypothetical protein
MVVSRHQNTGQNHNVLITNKSFENVAKFKHSATTATNQNSLHKKKFRAVQIRGVLATVLFRVFCLPAPSLKL